MRGTRTPGVTGLSALGAALLIMAAPPASAQSTRNGPTLRHGSGLLDVPVASTLPAGALRFTYSGFWADHDREPVVDSRGRITGDAAFDGGWRGDLSVAYGLWELFEFGANLQSVADEEDGGVLGGAFGRLVLFDAEAGGLGLAFGGRWSNGPDFGDGVDRGPGRLGVADRRLRSELTADGLHTEWSAYAVATVDLPGPRSRFLPETDWTLTGGWGTGMFSDGDGLDWYEVTDSEGWFAGAAVHMAVGTGSVLSLETDFNGFDWNAGAELALRGLRVGAHLLGVNHAEEISIYRSRKFGLSLSVDLCGPGLCPPELRERVPGGIVVLPAPPPDTIVVREEPPPLPQGEAVEICLANGRSVGVLLTSQGDTLVGDPPRSIATLRPALDWAGDYAEGRAWYDGGEALDHGGRRYIPVRGLLRLSCPALERVGEHMGVPVFGMRATDPPAATVYVPVRPGVWRAFQLADPGISPPGAPR